MLVFLFFGWGESHLIETSHFKVYNPMLFGIFTMLWIHRDYLVSKYFHQLGKKSSAH